MEYDVSGLRQRHLTGDSCSSFTPITLAAMPETPDLRMNCSEFWKVSVCAICCEDASLSARVTLALHLCFPSFLFATSIYRCVNCCAASYAKDDHLLIRIILSSLLSFISSSKVVNFTILEKACHFWADSFALCSQSGFGFDLKMKLWVKISFRLIGFFL